MSTRNALRFCLATALLLLSVLCPLWVGVEAAADELCSPEECRAHCRSLGFSDGVCVVTSCKCMR